MESWTTTQQSATVVNAVEPHTFGDLQPHRYLPGGNRGLIDVIGGPHARPMGLTRPMHAQVQPQHFETTLEHLVFSFKPPPPGHVHHPRFPVTGLALFQGSYSSSGRKAA